MLTLVVHDFDAVIQSFFELFEKLIPITNLCKPSHYVITISIKTSSRSLKKMDKKEKSFKNLL